MYGYTNIGKMVSDAQYRWGRTNRLTNMDVTTRNFCLKNVRQEKYQMVTHRAICRQVLTGGYVRCIFLKLM